MPPTRTPPRRVRLLLALALAAAWMAPPSAQPRGDINSPIDLVMLQLLMPAKVRLGDKFQLRDEVENGGESESPDSITIYYLSADEVLDDKDLAIKGRRVPPLKPGQRQSQPTTMTIEFDVPPGTYYLIAAADARKQVDERIEGNNTKATRFTLLPKR
jgi:hypothetical protein